MPLFPPNIRRKILLKLAQEGTTTTQVPKTVSGSPPSFTASNLFPTTILGLTSKNASVLNSLAKTLNDAIFYASDGYFSLQRLKDQNFSFAASDFSSNLKFLVQFASQLNSLFFTDHGKPFTAQLSPEEIKIRAGSLFNSAPLNSLSSINPSSQLAQKVSPNLKAALQNQLLQFS